MSFFYICVALDSFQLSTTSGWEPVTGSLTSRTAYKKGLGEKVAPISLAEGDHHCLEEPPSFSRHPSLGDHWKKESFAGPTMSQWFLGIPRLLHCLEARMTLIIT